MTKDNGRSPSGSGSRASHEAAGASSPKASIPNAVEYPVGTLAQMAAIPLEARERFLSELPALLDTAARFMSLQGLFGDDVEADLGEPTWIDDCATNVTVNVNFQDAGGKSIAKSTTTFDHALASAIEARSDATGTGAAEGESATSEAGDAR